MLNSKRNDHIWTLIIFLSTRTTRRLTVGKGKGWWKTQLKWTTSPLVKGKIIKFGNHNLIEK